MTLFDALGKHPLQTFITSFEAPATRAQGALFAAQPFVHFQHVAREAFRYRRGGITTFRPRRSVIAVIAGPAAWPAWVRIAGSRRSRHHRGQGCRDIR